MSEPEVSPPVVDARGRPCPVPILMLATALKAHERAWLWGDDPAVESDLRAMCQSAGHEVVALERTGRLIKALVQRRARGT